VTYRTPSDDKIAKVLQTARTFAVIGASGNPGRPSHGVMRYLLASGYDVVPVNPGLAGSELLGQPVAADLASIARAIDVVDIFRNSDAALDAVRAAIREKQRLAIKAVWMQLGVINEAAAAEADAAGLIVIMDRCPAIERPRLLGS
jgi:hypothetical protein